MRFHLVRDRMAGEGWRGQSTVRLPGLTHTNVVP